MKTSLMISDLFIKDLPDVVNEPLPHIYSDNILNIDFLEKIYSDFPSNDSPNWLGHGSAKQLMGGSTKGWPDIGKKVFSILQSEEFCSLLSNKFNTPKLYPTTIGGGYQTSGPMSSLGMHIDPQIINNKYRWLNLHIYLNKNWNKFHGGELILVNTETSRHISVEPKFGTIIIYNSGSTTFHGHPSRWLGNNGRRNVSIYYFADSQMNNLNKFNVEKYNLTNIQLQQLTRANSVDAEQRLRDHGVNFDEDIINKY